MKVMNGYQLAKNEVHIKMTPRMNPPHAASHLAVERRHCVAPYSNIAQWHYHAAAAAI